ncbi:MAG: hypothetical protein WC330_03775 [Candidatus Omnitrophota bacterium]|jgi:hypothetical protein
MDLREKIREECRQLGLTKVRERLGQIGIYTMTEGPVVRAWVKEEEDRLANKIKLRDYISFGIGLLGIVVAVMLGVRNKELEDSRQQIHDEAKIVQQYITNNNYNFPAEVVKAVNNITTVSGDVVVIGK